MSYIATDQVKGKINDYKSFIYLLRFAKPFRYKFIFALSLLNLSAVLAIISSRFIGVLIDKGLSQSNRELSFKYIAYILSLEICAIVCVWIGRRFLAQASCSMILQIRKELFRHIHFLPISYYDRQPQGRIVTRITHDVEGMEEFFTSAMGRLISSVIMFHIALIAMVVTNLKLGLILASCMIPAVVFTIVTRKVVRETNREMSRANSACNAKLSEFLNGLNVIRSFGLEAWSKKNYDEIVDTHLNSQLTANKFYSWSRPVTSFLCYLPLVGLLFVGGQSVMDGTLTLGIFVAFVRYCERFSNPIEALTREVGVIQQAFTSAERVTTFLQEEKEDHELGPDGNLCPEKLNGEIEFQNLEMSYQKNTHVLEDISFHILPGEKIGIVGTTGSGKTTTISLLTRLYEFQKGDILIDGVSIRNYSRAYLRRKIGLVSQDVILFKGSLRENLVCGGSVNDEQILNAINLTGLSLVMKNNNMTLESHILDNGTNLSVGERQLISLCRILLKDPAILILDEATSNIDPVFEQVIHQAVNVVMKGRTCLLIAHRLDTLKHCDRVLVFKNGHLIEQGKQSDLINDKKYFYHLYLESKERKNQFSEI